MIRPTGRHTVEWELTIPIYLSVFLSVCLSIYCVSKGTNLKNDPPPQTMHIHISISLSLSIYIYIYHVYIMHICVGSHGT